MTRFMTISTGSYRWKPSMGVPCAWGPRWDIVLVACLTKGGLDLNQSTSVSSHVKYILHQDTMETLQSFAYHDSKYDLKVDMMAHELANWFHPDTL